MSGGAVGEQAVSTAQVRSDVPVVMRDGTILRADVYSPAEGGPYPCVLYRTPYGKTGRFGPGPLAESIASRGYLVVVQDIHCQGEETFVDSRIPLAVQERLRELGHDVVPQKETPAPANFASVSAVARNPATGELTGGSSPAWNTAVAGV